MGFVSQDQDFKSHCFFPFVSINHCSLYVMLSEFETFLTLSPILRCFEFVSIIFHLCLDIFNIEELPNLY